MRKDMVIAGMYVNTADAVNGSVTPANLTATGTTIADALALANDLNVVGTTASGTGVKLQLAEAGDYIYVHNLGANALLVYPNTATEVINALSAGAAFSVGAGKAAIFRKLRTANWVAMLGA